MMYAPNPGEYASIAANQRVKREDEAMAIKSAMATAPILATDYQQITGAIPSGPVTDATEMVFVAGRAFVEASRHEQATGRLSAERDHWKATVNAAQNEGERLTEETDAALCERDEVIAERDRWEAAANTAQGKVERLTEQRDALRRRLSSIAGLVREVEVTSRVMSERDALRAQLDDLICETRDGLCSPLCCNRCGQSLGNGEMCSSGLHVGPGDDDFGPNAGHPVPAVDLVAERDAARADVDTLLEAIAAVTPKIEASPHSPRLAAAMRILTGAASAIREGRA